MSANSPIRSRANALLKRVAAVSAGRDKECVVLEGVRLVDDALRAGWALELALVSEAQPERAAALAGRAREVRLVADDLLAQVSTLATPPGVLALAPRPHGRALGELELGPQALVLAVAGIADPGNLGALARSAEAFGACALVRVAGSASAWNAKALRGSMGSLLRLPVVEASSAAQAAGELAAHGFRSVCAATRGGIDARAFDWSGRVALWIGGETGAPLELGVPNAEVSIAMAGAVESLNVTVAASLLLYAARGARA